MVIQKSVPWMHLDELLARGHQVRALAHGQDERSKKLQERGVEVVYGDLLDFGQVRSALSGVKRAYFVYPIRPGILQATAYFAQAAKEAGVEGIVNPRSAAIGSSSLSGVRSIRLYSICSPTNGVHPRSSARMLAFATTHAGMSDTPA
jgi:NmrA-like family